MAPAASTTAPPNVDTSGFTMTIPSSWVPIDLEKMDAAAVKAKLKGTQFEVRAADMEKMRSMVNFFAFDADNSKPGVFANINVVSMPANASVEQIIEANIKQMKSMDPTAEEVKGLTTLPNSAALTYTMMGMDMIAVLAVQGGKQHVITYSAPKGTDKEKMKSILGPIADSFRGK